MLRSGYSESELLPDSHALTGINAQLRTLDKRIGKVALAQVSERTDFSSCDDFRKLRCAYAGFS